MADSAKCLGSRSAESPSTVPPYEIYDRQGNLANKNGQAYLFDYGNRLREVPDKEGYHYDGHGRRILSWRPDGGLDFFLYGQSGQLWYHEYDAKSLGVENVYLAGSLIASREFDWSAGTFTTKYHHTDALGSPVAVTNSVGQVTERTDWEPYGAAIGKPNYEGIGFTGHVQDAATGLTYMQQRYYDPLIGLFLSVDPVTAYSNSVGQFHRYRYANSNPYKFRDPDGRLVCGGVNSGCRQLRDKLDRQGMPTFSAGSGAGDDKSGKSNPIRTLDAITVDGPKQATNGAVRWEVRWDISIPSKLGGWVVQRMQISSGGTYTSGETETNPGRVYWEAWRVEPGQSSATGTDTFRRGPVNTDIIRNMYMKWDGSARFYEGLNLPGSFVWGLVPSAGNMRSTYEDPKLPLDNATEPVNRTFEMKFP